MKTLGCRFIAHIGHEPLSPKTLKKTSFCHGSSLGLGDLETEFGCPGTQGLDLLVSVSLFVVFSPFVDVLLTVLQHSVDEPSEPVRHRRDGLWGTKPGAQTAILRSEVGAAAH